VILLFNIDGPHVMGSAVDVVDGQHCGEHRVILVVVLVHAVSTDEVHVWHVLVEVVCNDLDVRLVVAVVVRVGLGHAEYIANFNISSLGDGSFLSSSDSGFSGAGSIVAR